MRIGGRGAGHQNPLGVAGHVVVVSPSGETATFELGGQVEIALNTSNTLPSLDYRRTGIVIRLGARSPEPPAWMMREFTL